MARSPDVGEKAPEFTLDSTTGELRLGALLERGPVLLVFYPGDDTPVCTKQLCDYRDNLEAFAELGIQVVAINAQSLDSHRAFAEKRGLPFPIASDPDRTVCRAYGATGLLGMTKRALFLVGSDGIIRYQHTDLPVFRRTAQELRARFAELAL